MRYKTERNTEKVRRYRARRRAREQARANGDETYIDPITGEVLPIDSPPSAPTLDGKPAARAAHQQQQADLLDEGDYEYEYEDETEGGQGSLWGLLAIAALVGGLILAGIIRAREQ